MALSETLELDIVAALGSIDSLEAALTVAASNFATSLAEATAPLGNVSVEADASPVTIAIDDAVTSADTLAVVEGDAEAVGSAIDEAVGSADSVVAVDADATGVGSAIDDAVAAADTSVDVDADAGSVTSAIEEAVADANTTVEINADTQSLSNLSSLSSGAAGGLGKLSGSALTATAALGGTVLGVAGLGAGITKLVTSSAEAQAVQQRFNDTFKESATAIESINVGGLVGSLSDLAIQAGANDEGLKSVAIGIGRLGEASGLTTVQTAKTAEQILALGLSISAARPELGSADQVAAALAASFARGGARAQQFGLALDTGAVSAHAVATALGVTDEALKKLDPKKVDEVTQSLTRGQLQASAAELAVDQLGTRLGGDFARNTDTAQAKLKAAGQALDEAFEAVDEQTIRDLTQAISDIAPSLVKLVEGFAKATTFAIDFITVLESAENPMQAIGGAIFDAGAKVVEFGGRIVHAGQQVVSFVSDAVSAVLALPGRFAEAASGLAGSLVSGGRKAIDGLVSGMTATVGGAISFVGSIDNRLRDALGDLGGLLVGAGRALMGGLLRGIQDGVGNVLGFVGGIAKKIANVKGPLDYDRRLLTPAGLAIMEGLGEGLRVGFAGVQRDMERVTLDLATFSPSVSVSGALAGGSAATAGFGGPSVGTLNVYEAVSAAATADAVSARIAAEATR